MTHRFTPTQALAGAALLCLSVTANAASDPQTRSASTPAAATPSAHIKPSARKTNWTVGQLRTSKTRMGVGMRYAVSEPSVGQTATLNLRLTRLGTGEPVTLELRPDPALQMVGGMPTGQVVFNAGDEYSIGLRPEAEGLHYIHVYLQSGQKAEALAIPVQVGKTQQLSKPGPVTTMPDGQRVMAMPAQQ